MADTTGRHGTAETAAEAGSGTAKAEFRGALLLTPEPLTAEAFAPFGDVIAAAGPGAPINGGAATRFSELGAISVGGEGGRATIAIVRTGVGADFPLDLRMLERHPLGSQAFIPLGDAPFLVVVARDEGNGPAAGIRAFRTDGRQGINYRANTWHHPLIALRPGDEFLVIDRAGEGVNLEVMALPKIALSG